MGIKKETIEFVEMAKKYFESDEGKIIGATYQDTDLGYIALRWGLMDDCVKVFELGEEVGLFEQWIDRVPRKDLLDYYIKEIGYKDYELSIEQLNKMESIIYKRKLQLERKDN